MFYLLGGGAFADVEINATNFPDENFRNYVSTNCDSNGDGTLSDAEIALVRVINVYNSTYYLQDESTFISSLKGIEYFTGLVSLVCSGNSLTELDVSANTALEELYCWGNELTALDVSKNTALKCLDCDANRLTALDLSRNTALMYLYCDNNCLTALDLSRNTALTELECYYNRLTALDLSRNTALVYLDCSENRFSDLDISGHRFLQEFHCNEEEYGSLKTLNLSGCTSLTDLDLDYASLTHLNLSGCTSLGSLYLEVIPFLTELNVSGCTNLTELDCGDNDGTQGSLTSLNLTGCTALKSLYCSYQKLTSLNVSNLTNLTELFCYNNALTALDVSKNLALESLYCGYNYLTSLNVSNNTVLKDLECTSNYLSTLNVSNNTALTYLNCSENELTALDVNKNVALTSLYCSSNKLASLNVSNNTKLERLYFDDNNISAIDLSSNTALTGIGIAYNQLASMDLSRYTAMDRVYCDFPITKGANSTWEFDFTAFKSTYGIDGEFDSSFGVTVHYSKGDPLSNYTIDQSSGKYIMRFLRLAEGTLESVYFHCRLNNSTRTISVYLCPSVDSSSLKAPLITTSSLPAVSIDKDGYYNDYEQYLSAYGSPYITWKIIDGFPPAGLYMDYDGEIYGYPIAAGSYTFTVRARNKAGSSSRTFTIVVPYLTAKEPPIITTTSLTSGTSSIPYGYQLTVTGTTPIKWIADDLLDGFALSSAGYISGTPTESGTFSLSVTASNDYDTDSRTLYLTVTEAPSGTKPSITTDALDAATAGSAYSYQLGVSGTPPITWTVKGKLPDGLSMNSSGLITGTPKKKGSKKFTITAKNSAGEEKKKLTITVYELPEILTETLKDAIPGKKYKQTLKANGSKPLTWEIEGDLPEGITFDASKGKFSGTPTAITTGAVNITLTNSVGSVSQTYTLKVAGTPPKIGLSKLKDGKYGKSYTAKLKVKGSEPITLTLVGELPEGLSFDSSAGTITGTPTEACTDRAIRVIASNAADVVSKDYTLMIKAVAPKFQTKKLSDAVKGKDYSADIEVTGTAPITFAATGLPAGLTISNDGTISGTPTEAGKFKATVTAANSAKTVKKSMNLTVLAAPEFSGSSTLTSVNTGQKLQAHVRRNRLKDYHVQHSEGIDSGRNVSQH